MLRPSAPPQLGQGYHYITVEAFTHRTDGGPAVYTDWKETVYIDLAPPNSAPASFASTSYQQWTLDVTSVDGLANRRPHLPGSPVRSHQRPGSCRHRFFQSGNPGGYQPLAIGLLKPQQRKITRSRSSATSRMVPTTFSASAKINIPTSGSPMGTASDWVISTATARWIRTTSARLSPCWRATTHSSIRVPDINGDGSIDLADLFLLGPGPLLPQREPGHLDGIQQLCQRCWKHMGGDAHIHRQWQERGLRRDRWNH